MKDQVIKIRVCEVGPRDGLQSLAPLTVQQRASFLEKLHSTGLRYLEAGSFVSPKAVPAMAGTADVMSLVSGRVDAELVALILNGRGLDDALKAGVRGVGIVTMVSDDFSLKNNGCSASETLERGLRLANRAKSEGLFVRVNISPAWHCPYGGSIEQAKVLDAVQHLMAAPFDELCLCDTTGQALAEEVSELFEKVSRLVPVEKLAGHFHDTYQHGIENIAAALDLGVRTFDSSVGGIGGCPFAPGAKGNVATEDLCRLAIDRSLETGIHLEQLEAVATWIHQELAKAEASS